MVRVNAYTYLLLILLLLSRSSYGQNKEDSLFNIFRTDIIIEQDENDGCVFWDDDTKESYYSLLSQLSFDALKKYVSDSNAVIRSAIFVGLAQKTADENILEEIFAAYANDTAKFTSGTDAFITWSVRDYMQSALELKAKGKLPDIDYQARLEEIQKRPKIIIAGARHNIISKDLLLKVKELTYSAEGCKIISFRVITDNEEVFINGSRFLTEEVCPLIKNLKPGDRIFIEKIIAELPDKSMMRLPSIVLKIK